MKKFRVRFSRRLRLLLLVLATGALVRFAYPAPAPLTLTGVARMLAEASGTLVGPHDFVWEPSRGVLLDALVGRYVLFLGRAESHPDDEGKGPRDLFRASVRVSLEGRPISVGRPINLTATPFGDEQGLVGHGKYAAFATVAFGAVQQVTLLDLDGDEGEFEQGVVDGLLSSLTNLQDTGSVRGLRRVEVSANLEASSSSLAMDDRVLSVSVGDQQAKFAVDLASGALIPGSGGEQAGVSAIRVPRLPKPLILWAVDTVRSVTGPAPIAWLERYVFDARDLFHRTTYWAKGGDEDGGTTLSETPSPPPPPPPVRTVGAEGFERDTTWPPQPLRSIWKKAEPDEGQWKPVTYPFLKKVKVTEASGEAPPYYFRTYVRPDPKRPYSKVLLVAMDSRQLNLGMEGGIEDPKPLTGARGEGRIPRDPETLHRAVGAFNGAFKTTHGEYGMMVKRRVLVPPKPGAATVVAMPDGAAGFGTWPDSPSIPENIVSFRQNMEPLVADSLLNPSRRKQWGWHLHGTHMLTHRSGLCLTSTGHMIYAWGAEVNGETLGRAMIQAGCVHGIHLDMNPRHTAFVFLDVRSIAGKRYDTRILTPEMEVLAERFLVWSPKDFFYLTLGNFGPSPIKGVRLRPDGGTQPPPVWAPAILRGEMSAKTGSKVSLFGLSPKRTSIRLAPSRSSSLSGAEAKRVLAAIVLHEEQDQTEGGALLTLGRRVRLSLSQGSEKTRDSVNSIALPLLKAGKQLSVRATRRGTARDRSAICVHHDGFVWIAKTKSPTDEPLVSTLSKAGCDFIASLDRGSDGGARIDRAGTKSPPVSRYDTPTLYVFGKPLSARGFPWGASARR